jgi:hypothetical protein
MNLYDNFDRHVNLAICWYSHSTSKLKTNIESVTLLWYTLDHLCFTSFLVPFQWYREFIVSLSTNENRYELAVYPCRGTLALG